MAVSWPFDSILTQDENGDPVYSRTYSADVLAGILARYFRNGVFPEPSTNLQVLQNEGMTVLVKPGAANVNGRQFGEESDRVLTVQAASGELDRIDSVVLRLNLEQSALTVDLYIVAGTPSAVPASPELTRNASVWELGLANLFIAKNTTTVTQQRITDTRLDSERCGIVASIIGDTDTSAYYAQIQAELESFRSQNEVAFTDWFATVQGVLGEEEAGNLLNNINKYKAKNTTVTLALADWALTGSVYVQTKNVSIVPANCALHVSPTWASRVAYNDAECGVSAASAGSVVFTATAIPAAPLVVNLSVSEVDV